MTYKCIRLKQLNFGRYLVRCQIWPYGHIFCNFSRDQPANDSRLFTYELKIFLAPTLATDRNNSCRSKRGSFLPSLVKKISSLGWDVFAIVVERQRTEGDPQSLPCALYMWAKKGAIRNRDLWLMIFLIKWTNGNISNERKPYHIVLISN